MSGTLGSRERRLARLLAETLRFWKRVEQCDRCVSPKEGLEGEHEREWKILNERIRRELATEAN